MNDFKYEFEVFDLGELVKLQTKINQWITIGKYISHRITPLSDRTFLVEYRVHK